ncbi:non-ribosomal peptide synthetase [Labedaea rhizosphaerae]|uniref:non-ribosomal peptide synthetase n=1 Tax=Labedaea rhizosphaerae TaxID=598644 RepID=UPI001414DFB8|nr:non-ribosomal peptide synthetase [Labedaea rhizosphaerae]
MSQDRGGESRREKVVRALFAEVLGVARLGVDDDFFALGGTPKSAAVLRARLHAVFGVTVSEAEFADAPTVAGIAATVAPGGATRPIRPTVRSARPARLPLSWEQRRLWAADGLATPGEYTMTAGYRLTGALDVPKLEAALSRLVARHETLRTTFDEGGQVIHPPHEVELPVLHTTALDAPPLDELVRREQTRPIDLRTLPALRALLVRLGPTEHVLLLTLHHILTDRRSTGILARDLAELYRAEVTGEPAALPRLAVQYADYALWQQDRDEPDVGHWRDRLRGAPVLELPTDRPRPPVRSAAGDLVTFTVPAPVVAGLSGRARARGASTYMALVALVQVLLSRHSGQHDVVLGTPVSTRDRDEVAELAGFFVNTLALRSTVDESVSFAEFLGTVRETVLTAFAHAEVPFERVVAEVVTERDPSRTPLVQAALVVQSAEAVVEVPGLRLAELALPSPVPRYDLSVQLVPDGGGFAGTVIYATDLFDVATATRFARHLVVLAEQVVAAPDVPLHEVSSLDAEEHRQLVADWQGPPGRPPAHFVELFTTRVAAAPGAPALAFEGTVVTYAELDRWTNRLARLLLARGVGPEDIVALPLPRGPESIAVVLAVFKAGAAYLPVDTTYPAERIEFLLADSGAALAITTGGFTAGVPTVALDDVATAAELAATGDGPVTDAERGGPLLAQHAAYVIYTSGSTGAPKGVLVSHLGVANMASAVARRLAMGPGSRSLQFVSPSFDASFGELSVALLSGATLVLAPVERLRPGPPLVELVRQQRITHLGVPPTVLAALAPGSLPAGLNLVVGGEDCPPELVRRWAGRVTMVNLYGPTECTVTATASAPLVEDEPVSLGLPVDGLRAYVLDAHLRPVPIGVPGELHLAGPGLARGYLGRPATTAAAFVPDPFGGPGDRMYRTGDLVRRRHDGVLVYAGRRDDQVKVRGFRIELGEVEAALAAHPAVTVAAAVTQTDHNGHRRLVGYVVTDADLTPQALRDHLTERLPDYMVPTAFVFLDELPTTASGKVDRAALPAPAVVAGGRAPRTTRETLLCTVFAAVLGLPRVGVDDSFFVLGGDSILAIEVVSRARQAGLVFTVSDMFRHTTVAELAAAATEVTPAERSDGDDDGVGDVRRTPIMEWLRASGIPLDGFNQAVVVRTPAGLRVEDLTDALQQLLDHHDMLRLRVHDDWSLHVPEPGSVTATDCLQRMDVEGADFTELVATAARLALDRLDPARGLVLQAVWCDAGPVRAGRLVLVAHHLVVDGVSWRILLTDLARALADDPLLPVGTSFRRWAAALAAGSRAAELPFWLNTSAVPDPPLGTRRLDPARDTAATTRELELRLPAADTRPLLTAVPASVHGGVNDVLLAAFALAARRRGIGSAAGVLVDLEGHGREEAVAAADLSRTVGWFTTQFPVRLDVGGIDVEEALRGGPAAGRALVRVKEQLRAVPDNGIGFGILRYLDPAARPRLAELPTPQLGFNYLGRFAAADGWGLAPEPAGIGALPPQAPVPHVLHLLAITRDTPAGPELGATWSWPDGLLSEHEVRAFADTWFAALRALTRHARGLDAGVRTPSDLPLVSVTQHEIDEFTDHLRA